MGPDIAGDSYLSSKRGHFVHPLCMELPYGGSQVFPIKGEHHRREDYAGNGEGLFSVVLEMDCKINVLTIKTHGQSQLEHGFSVYLHVYYTCGILNPNSDGTYGKKKRYTGKFLLFSANILSKILSIK